MSEDVMPMTWVHFINLFHEKYLSEASTAGKIWEFMNLRQGKMCVAEYVANFDELAKFSLSVVLTDQARKMKFMHGLNVELVKLVESGDTGPRTCVAVQRALRIDTWRGDVAVSAPTPLTVVPHH